MPAPYRITRRGTVVPIKRPLPVSSNVGRAMKIAKTVGTIARVGKAAMSSTPMTALATEAAYQIGSSIAKRMFSRGTQAGRSQTAKKFAYRTTGRYRGVFKKKRIGKSSKAKYLSGGYENTQEITGVVNDPDCVYVGHSTTAGFKIMTVFLQACLRKLFYKFGGQDLLSVNQKIKGYANLTNNDSDGWQLILVTQNKTTGVYTNYMYDTITPSDTIYRIVGDPGLNVAPAWEDLWKIWADYAGNRFILSQSGESQVVPVKLQLYGRDGNGPGANFHHFRGEINFDNEVIHMKVVSELKIQNRTKAASGSGDSEDVSNNPLVGKLYQFSDSVPRLKSSELGTGGYVLERVNDSTGAQTLRAVDMNGGGFGLGTQTWKEPPNYQVFRNCRKTAKVNIGPGDIKKDVIVFTMSAQVYKFFDKLNWVPTTTSLSTNNFAIQTRAMGKFSLIALEDIINVNGAENISVAYEINRTEAMYLTTMKRSGSLGQFSAQVQNSAA